MPATDHSRLRRVPGGSSRIRTSLPCRSADGHAEACWLQGIPGIIGPDVHAIRVGLPQLDERIRDRLPVTVENANRHSYPLAGRVGASEAAERRVVGQSEVKERADRLRRRRNETDRCVSHAARSYTQLSYDRLFAADLTGHPNDNVYDFYTSVHNT